MKIRGKNLTVNQKKMLVQNHIIDPDNYLYVKMETINLGSSKRLSQGCPKVEIMVVIHRNTGVVERIPVKEV